MPAAGQAGRPPGLDEGLLDNFYNYDVLGTLVSEQAFQASFNLSWANLVRT